jgi:hypothetical protein
MIASFKLYLIGWNKRKCLKNQNLFLLAMAIFFMIGRLIVWRYARQATFPQTGWIKSLALTIIGLGGIYYLVTNPFSLLFFIPLLFWLLLDILFFLLGGLMVYALFYFFGFAIMYMNFTVLWYILMMFSVGEVSLLTALMITAIMAAGLSMIVTPQVKMAN